jgi:hypothetical protein
MVKYCQSFEKLFPYNVHEWCIVEQVFRALRVPITSRMLSDILSRLVETVAEQGEDMQVNAKIS